MTVLTRRTSSKLLSLLVALVIMLIVVFPLYWMAITALKPGAEIYASEPTLYPHAPTFEGFVNLFERIPFGRYLLNSVIVAVGATVIATCCASLAAYGLTRLTFRGRDLLGGLFFSTYLVPISVLFIPIFLMMDAFALTNTYWGLIIAYQSFTIPFSVWLLRGYFQNIPTDLEDAARVDGCNRLQALIRVVLPIAAPGITASAIFAFTLTWNEFLLAVVLMTRQDRTTAPVGLQSFLFADSANWAELMAGAVIMGVPIVILYLVAERYIVSGLAAGSVKG
jgi:multiple sugar transport system permease protein